MIRKVCKGFCFSVSIVFLFSGCNNDYSKNNIDELNDSALSYEISIAQGVWGKVEFWEGDHMPGVVGIESSGTITPVSRVIHIYSGTRSDENVSKLGYFYENLNTELVAVTYSDQNGYYQVELPEGVFSVFIEEDLGLFANRAEGFIINPVVIEKDTVSLLNIDITYMASF